MINLRKIYTKFSNLNLDKALNLVKKNIKSTKEKKKSKNNLSIILNRWLPSSKLNTDEFFLYNQNSSVKPIALHALSLIYPIKKKLLADRKLIQTIDIQRSNKKMALIVPYRHREEHLKQFIPYISNYLYNHDIDFEIIIVEQTDEKPFNRAKLMNIGALHASRESEYFVFHDVDLLPENIDYRFCNHSLKLFTYIKQEDETYKKYKETNFGGATLVPKEIFFDINGFSNNYWQWGSEDDDFLMRHLYKGYTPVYDTEGKFKTLPHEQALTLDTQGKKTFSQKILKENKRLRQNNNKTFSKFKRGITKQEDDGISTINNFEILKVTQTDNLRVVYAHFA